MSLNIDAKILNKAMKDDLKSLLMEIIDTQLTKADAEMDCELIEECTDMLIALEQEEDNGMAVMIPLTSSKKIMSLCTVAAKSSGWKHLSRGARAAVAACIVLFSAMTANATVKELFDVDIAKEVAKAVSTKLEDWGIIANAELEEGIVVNNVPATTTQPTTQPAEQIKAAVQNSVQKAAVAPAANQSRHNIDIIDGEDFEDTTSNHNIDIIEGEDFDDETTKPTKPTTKQHNIDIIEGEDFDEPTTEPTTQAPASPRDKYEHKLYFDANGGKCDVEYIDVYEAKMLGVLPEATREGYRFNGWYNIDLSYTTNAFTKEKTAKMLTQTTYYSLTEDATATAEWLVEFEIELDANGGECDSDKLETYQSEKIYSKLPTPVKDGYVFAGWFTEPEGGTEVTSSYTAKSKTTKLYAHWTENSFTVTLDANGGTCEQSSITVKYGEEMSDLPVPTRDGYVFAGWYSTMSVSGTPFTNTTKYTYKNDIKIYAVWAKYDYTMYFDANGGTCDVESMTIYYDNYVGELPKPVRPGYTFNGWKYNDTSITSTYKVSKRADMTVVASWSLARIGITLDGNGGTVPNNGSNANKVYYTYLSPVSGLYDAFRSDGYAFAGWFTEPEGGTEVKNGDMVDNTSGFTLYAHWEKLDEYSTVTIHYCDGTSLPMQMSVEAGEKLDLDSIDIPETRSIKVGGIAVSAIEFAGWFNDEFYGEEVTGEIDVDENMNIYARWTLIKQSVGITNNHSVYNLDEEFDCNSVDATLYGIVNYGYTIINNLRLNFDDDPELWASFFSNTDTSTIGEHTFNFNCSIYLDQFGLIMMDGTGTYKVVDCSHEDTKDTHIENVIEPTCTTEGYTGDAICDECGAVVEKGEIIPALGHIEVIEDAVKPDGKGCPGYSGDVYCDRCHRMLEQGHLLGEHGENADTYIDNAFDASCYSSGFTGNVICRHCDEIVKAGEWTAPLNHLDENGEQHTTLYNYKAPTCVEDGYTGDVGCDMCYNVLEIGEVIPAYGHNDDTETVLKNAEEPTQCYDGYTGNICCAECGKVFEWGHTIPALGHDETTKTVIRNQRDATQCYNGNTGDTRCAVCDKLLVKGETIPALGHDETTQTILRNAKAATSCTDGYTGDICCAICKQVFTKGEIIPAFGHNENTATVVKNKKTATCTAEGYTGDTCCAECGEILTKGEAIPALGHGTSGYALTNGKASTCSDYGYSGDKICLLCGEVVESGYILQKAAHKYVTVTSTPATDTANGKKTTKCTVCDGELVTTTIQRISSVTLEKDSFYYTGSRITPNVVALDIAGKKITSYEISYSADPVQIGSYVMTVTFTGDYSATYFLPFKIVKELGSNAPVITDVTKIVNGITVSWDADETQFEGYEIKVMSDTTTLTTSTIKDPTIKTRKLTGLRYPSTAIVKIRGYRTEDVNGVATKVYSDWSNEVTLP